TPSRIHVRPHTEVRFEVVNRDFLNHEFIIGGDDVHARHEAGHEAWHPPVPGEVSIAPHTTGATTYAFHAPGKVLFPCHPPGHLRELEAEAALGEPRLEFLHLDVDDALDVGLVEPVEHHDLVDTVEELGLEVTAHDVQYRALVGTATEVARHDEHGVGEVDG